jgi:hypothetical protein
VIFGVESVSVPKATSSGKFFTFVFPYSHGLASSVLWSLLVALAGWLLVGAQFPHRSKLAWILALAVLSHFALDFIVHVPDLPISGQSSRKLGLGLWHHMPIALSVELVFAAVALVVYLRSASLTRPRAAVAGGMVLVAAGLTAAGPYIPGEPPAAAALAASSLATLLVVVLLGFAVEGRFGVTAARHVTT